VKSKEREHKKKKKSTEEIGGGERREESIFPEEVHKVSKRSGVRYPISQKELTLASWASAVFLHHGWKESDKVKRVRKNSTPLQLRS